MLFGTLVIFAHLLAMALVQERELPVFALPAVIVGIAMVVAGFMMRSMTLADISKAGAVLAMLPLTLGWPLTFWVGLRAIRVLGKPEVRQGYGFKIRMEREKRARGHSNKVEWMWLIWLTLCFLIFGLLPLLAGVWAISDYF